MSATGCEYAPIPGHWRNQGHGLLIHVCGDRGWRTVSPFFYGSDELDRAIGDIAFSYDCLEDRDVVTIVEY